jgi:uncharacterized protein YeaO (DUF488 family)
VETRDVLRVKRAYEPPSRSDGYRILVDRLWPRGLSKERAAIDEWMKDVAPSAELRRWFGHDPEKWPEFQRRFRQELRARTDLVRDIARRASRGAVTLVYGARDEARNDAVVLAAVVRARLPRPGSAAPKPKHQTTRSRAPRRGVEESP